MHSFQAIKDSNFSSFPPIRWHMVSGPGNRHCLLLSGLVLFDPALPLDVVLAAV